MRSLWPLLIITVFLFMTGCSSSSLHHKAAWGTPQEVQSLINGGKNVNSTYSVSNRTPLWWAVMEGNLGTADILLMNGADINMGDAYGASPLIDVVQDGKLEMIDYLIKNGADLDYKDHGESALDRAAVHKQRESAKLLVLNGARVTSRNREYLEWPWDEWLKEAEVKKQKEREEARKAQIAAQNAKADRYRAKLEAKYKRDKSLPLDVRKDKYMVALTAHLKNEQFKEALIYFDWLTRLNVELPPSFTFFYGEALLRTGKPKEALGKLYAYIKIAGSGGKYYKKALGLTNEAEGML